LSLFGAFGQAVLPILTVIAIGYVFGIHTDTDPESLSTVAIYILVPALVFHSLVTTEVGGDDGLRIVAVSVVIMWGITEGVALFTTEKGTRNGLVLAGSFPNTANYGIPLSIFAFPSVGRTTAVLYVVGSSVMLYTVGVYIASRDAADSSVGALRRVVRIPLVYAVIAGVGANVAGVGGGGTVAFETLRLLGDSSIPIMLVVLGIQLARATPSGGVAEVALTNFLRLVVAPVVAVPVVLAFGFDNPDVARVVVLEASAPVAVTTVILTVEFDGDPDYVATAILTSTLMSVLTVTVLIELLRYGVFF